MGPKGLLLPPSTARERGAGGTGEASGPVPSCNGALEAVVFATLCGDGFMDSSPM